MMIKCARCGRQVEQFSREFITWESPDGQSWVCEGCLTRSERQTLDADHADFAAAMEAAGLGTNAHAEAMPETEYLMREDLANSLYEHDRAGKAK
jgi:hypothetical protein